MADLGLWEHRDGVWMRPTNLPADLQPLALRNAIEISDTRFDYDIGRLTEALERTAADAG